MSDGLSQWPTSGGGDVLRLLCPRWQGAGTSSVRALASEFPFDVARRGYAVGSAVLEAILPPGDGPTAVVPITMGEQGLGQVDGVEAKEILLEQLTSALRVIKQHDPRRIATLAVLWIDSHPDIGTPASEYPGWHAMAVAALTGHGTPTCWHCYRPP